MVKDTQQFEDRCHIFDNDHVHTCVLVRSNFVRQPLPTVANFHGVLNFMTIRAVTKITKISAPQIYPLYGIWKFNLYPKINLVWGRR